MSRSNAPLGSRYVDQRHYIVAARLTDLRGPVRGLVTLDRWLDWSGDRTYDLDDAGDRQLVYQLVLNQATKVEDLCRWLDGDTLRRLWPSLWLPTRLRALWQAAFPSLPGRDAQDQLRPSRTGRVNVLFHRATVRRQPPVRQVVQGQIQLGTGQERGRRRPQPGASRISMNVWHMRSGTAQGVLTLEQE